MTSAAEQTATKPIYNSDRDMGAVLYDSYTDEAAVRESEELARRACVAAARMETARIYGQLSRDSRFAAPRNVGETAKAVPVDIHAARRRRTA